MKTTSELIKNIQEMLELARVCPDISETRYGRVSWRWTADPEGVGSYITDLSPAHTRLLKLTGTITALAADITFRTAMIPSQEILSIFPLACRDVQFAACFGGEASALAAGWQTLALALPQWKAACFSQADIRPLDTNALAPAGPTRGAGALPGLLERLTPFLEVLETDEAVREALTGLLVVRSGADGIPGYSVPLP